MKRSKMIKSLTNYIDQFEDCKLDKNVANEILTFLENQGMLPPFYYKDVDNPMEADHFVYSEYDNKLAGFQRRTHTWESETKKKQ